MKRPFRKINFDTLCKLIANIDYIDDSTYPVSFAIQEGNWSHWFEAGICNVESDSIAATTYKATDEFQFLLDLGELDETVVDLQDPDSMSYDEIEEMLCTKCNIKEDSVIFLQEKLSFTGDGYCFGDEQFSDELIEELRRLGEEIKAEEEEEAEFQVVASK